VFVKAFIMRTMRSNIIPRAIAMLNSPRTVYMFIAVVRTLVLSPLFSTIIFPPIMRARPSSAIALLKPETIESITPFIPSFRTVIADLNLLAPSVIANSLMSFSTDSMELAVKVIIIGVISRDCARLMPRGVYIRLRGPSGPFGVSKRYIIRPSTTVGIPIKELKRFLRKFTPLNPPNPR